MTASTFIIADDHPLFRGALRQAVTGIDGEQTIIEAGDFEAARVAAQTHADADLMLLVLAMFIISKYELTDEKVDEINEEIERRHMEEK